MKEKLKMTKKEEYLEKKKKKKKKKAVPRIPMEKGERVQWRRRFVGWWVGHDQGSIIAFV